MTATAYLNDLNQRYLSIHRTKENFFWDTYMGLSDDHQGSTEAETAWTKFLSNAEQITAIKEQIALVDTIENIEEKKQTLIGLTGWLATFESHAIESEQAQTLKSELIKFEAGLFEKKQKHTMTYVNEEGKTVEGSLPVLASVVRTSSDENTRQSAHQAFLGLEQWLLQNGFIELIKLRNQFARSQGFNTFFDYSVTKKEKMNADELFSILDDFEIRTRDCNQASLNQLAADKGDNALLAHNFVFSFAGDVMRELDPYVPFSKSLRRWVESFGRLNIEFSDAELTLDLLDRKGKYPNGFCHGPIPSFYDEKGEWVAAKVNFTSNAKPDQIGSGYDGMNTLFHEGGHAAHFSNVKMNAPCFSQEFAPTSMAYAETQSMFCDSLLEDADWLKQYALDANGNSVPDSIIKAMIDSKQPFRAYQERSILVVPYFERALYQLTDEELTPENITALARATEKKILGLACSPRPLMAIPHLVSDEAACAYHGYLLAHMAVYQTRAYFTEKFGYLTDNPKIGPLLAKHYWNAGNSVSHNESIIALTGEGFNAKYLADKCNLSVEDAWKSEQEKIAELASRSQAEVAPLNASITIIDGAKTLASNTDSNAKMCDEFEAYIMETYGR
ncbi:M3 family metallopeptidase [Aliivibrio sp. S4TY2]|uniref:M3 family metallopeptidase n=1 Tax=unclassified Aliivibrio TaxID=2645654 RepID=UPI002379A26F|nr:MULTISPECIES: M3 family metallopeptidase [unclassified Aliivibrio]MDD9155286.1 M3 family metallopeptidase [Aliivibrio sp. S4TY2]MDD9159162.1 M3 family metallopeptidase [Aliivibrio sp. S4TY1]MDD9163288.1 M3 family metallopeptidase [Aliivibrio sp. S4MY2]MDD9167161.1 M3 family metallopeptidase [Aliivibrio sp. S4MY4]MDD9184365.1 M3 family metallopeptidase [Aliivibrio sp. S4MY3]